jgi:hypothetical protein
MLNLNKEIPGFADPAMKKQIMQSIDDYAISIGFTQKEADSIKDPRVVLMAYKAMVNSSTDGEKMPSEISRSGEYGIELMNAINSGKIQKGKLAGLLEA